MRLKVWGVPPGWGERAPQASRHNSTPEAAVAVGAVEVMGWGGGLAVGLESGAAVAVGIGVRDELGLAVDSFEQAPMVATTKPAVPANRSSRRRLKSSEPPSGRPGRTTFTGSRYGNSVADRGEAGRLIGGRSATFAREAVAEGGRSGV